MSSDSIEIRVRRYEKESVRLKSLAHWVIKFMDINLIARMGLYSTSESFEYLTCFFCNIKINNWIIGECPLVKHINSCPKCPIFTTSTINIPICKLEFLNMIAMYKNIVKLKKCDNYGVDTMFGLLPPLKKQFHLENFKKSLELRMLSFKYGSDAWKRELAKNGFVEDNKRIVCCVCNLEYDFETKLTVKAFHTIHSLSCKIVESYGSKETNITLRKEMIRKKIGIRAQKQTCDASTSTDDLFGPTRLVCDNDGGFLINITCRLCYVNPSEYAMIPCGHLIYCGSCKLKYTSKQCPLCNCKFSGVQKIYFP